LVRKYLDVRKALVVASRLHRPGAVHGRRAGQGRRGHPVNSQGLPGSPKPCEGFMNGYELGALLALVSLAFVGLVTLVSVFVPTRRRGWRA